MSNIKNKILMDYDGQGDFESEPDYRYHATQYDLHDDDTYWERNTYKERN